MLPRDAKTKCIELVHEILTPKPRKTNKNKPNQGEPSNLNSEQKIPLPDKKVIDRDQLDKVKVELFPSTTPKSNNKNQVDISSEEEFWWDQVEMADTFDTMKYRKYIDGVKEFSGKLEGLMKFISHVQYIFDSIPADVAATAIPNLIKYMVSRLCPDKIYLKLKQRDLQTFESFQKALKEIVYGSIELSDIHKTLDSIKQEIKQQQLSAICLPTLLSVVVIGMSQSCILMPLCDIRSFSSRFASSADCSSLATASHRISESV
jgi:hypothetical protein